MKDFCVLLVKISNLGVATLDYLPYCFMNWLNPLVAFALTALGIGIVWKKDDPEEAA